MKRDLMEEFEDRDLQPMHMSEEERRRVLENALGKLAAGAPTETAPVQPKKKRLRRIPRFAALLAAVIAAFALTAGAAHVFHMSGSLRAWFGDSATPELIESLGVAGWPIEQSQTVDGYTVTVQGVIGDKHTSYLVFDVEAPEGVTLNNKWGYGFQNCSLSSETLGGAVGATYWELPDDNPTDNKISYVYVRSSENSSIDEKFQFHLTDFLVYVDDYSGDGEWDNEKILASGDWKFSFEMEYTDISIQVPVNQSVAYPNSTAELTHIYISPLSVRLEYRRKLFSPLLFHSESSGHVMNDRFAAGIDEEEKAIFEEQASLRTQRRGEPIVVLHFSDGSKISEMDEQTGNTNSQLWDLNVTKSYRKLIDLDALTGVEIDGVLFPVNRP